jgi:hypothetical protein
MTGTSADFVHWSKPQLLDYPGAVNDHLYTNAIRNYQRADHLLIGFPTRYLPKEGSRVEPVLMSSREGVEFHRWPEAVIPEDAPEDRRGNRSNYMAWGMLQLPGRDREISVYATEAYYTGPDTRLRRFSYRLDGFASLSSEKSGELLTKPLLVKGNRLELNFVTRPEGEIQVEIQDLLGKPLKGFALDDCEPIRGDEIAATVRWKNGTDTSRLTNQPVRMKFTVKNADLFSFRFAE